MTTPDNGPCLHAWKLVGIGKIGRVYECTRCRLVWTPDEKKAATDNAS